MQSETIYMNIYYLLPFVLLKLLHVHVHFKLLVFVFLFLSIYCILKKRNMLPRAFLRSPHPVTCWTCICFIYSSVITHVFNNKVFMISYSTKGFVWRIFNPPADILKMQVFSSTRFSKLVIFLIWILMVQYIYIYIHNFDPSFFLQTTVRISFFLST